jgi:hypothetical protein
MKHPIERIRDAFDRAHRRIMGGPGSVHYMTIPPNRERDVDLILTDAIDELESLRADALKIKLAAYRAGVEAAAKACDDVSAGYYPHAKGPYNHCMSAIRALPDPTPETLEQIK